MLKIGDKITTITRTCPKIDSMGFVEPRNGTVVAIPPHKRFAVVDFGGWRECIFLDHNGDQMITLNEIAAQAEQDERRKTALKKNNPKARKKLLRT